MWPGAAPRAQGRLFWGARDSCGRSVCPGRMPSSLGGGSVPASFLCGACDDGDEVDARSWSGDEDGPSVKRAPVPAGGRRRQRTVLLGVE